MAIPVSLQLYTVRDECEKDYPGTLRKVAEIGYPGVELAGCPLKAEELKSLLDDLGMQVSGSHAGVEILESDPGKAIEFNLAIGSRYMILPYLPDECRTCADDYKRVAARANEVGALCNEHGLTFCYHNHSFEFETFEGRTGYDILVQETDPALVHLEIDTYWVQHGGHNPAEFLRVCGLLQSAQYRILHAIVGLLLGALISHSLGRDSR